MLSIAEPAVLAAPNRLSLRRGLDRLYLAAGGAGALCVALICVLMLWQSLSRVIGVSAGAVNDIVSWLAAAAAFLTMAHAFKHGDFVRVTLLLDRTGPRLRRVMELATLAIAAVSVAYLAWWACRFTFESWQFHEVAQGLLPLPMWIPQLSFAAGALLLLLAVVDEFFIVLGGAVPTYVREVQARHAQGDFSSDL